MADAGCLFPAAPQLIDAVGAYAADNDVPPPTNKDKPQF